MSKKYLPESIIGQTSENFFMQRCFQLAQMASGSTAPNPMVGAVLVYQGKIIGEGYHKKYGGPHAEINCLDSVKQEERSLIPFSTLYVSLEPCSHHGKTPPCADRILKEHIPRVVIGSRDPFPEVNGKGIEKLVAGGVETVYPYIEQTARIINRRFFTFHEKKRPYVILKWAESANQKMSDSNGGQIKISGKLSNRMVHKWRTEEAGILIGTNTAILDNPLLTARLWPGKNPIRIVMDTKLRLPESLNIFNGQAQTIILNYMTDFGRGHARAIKIDPTDQVIHSLLSSLYSSRILSLLVEGGPTLLQSFLDEGLWDELRVITNNDLYIDSGVNSPKMKNASCFRSEFLGSDSIRYYQQEGSTKFFGNPEFF